jgi:hypothetical protein
MRAFGIDLTIDEISERVDQIHLNLSQYSLMRKLSKMTTKIITEG